MSVKLPCYVRTVKSQYYRCFIILMVVGCLLSLGMPELGQPPSVPVAVDGVLQLSGPSANSSLIASSTSATVDKSYLTFEIVSNPRLGVLKLLDSSSGDFNYTANSAVTSSFRDSFSFRVVVSGGVSQPATITVIGVKSVAAEGEAAPAKVITPVRSRCTNAAAERQQVLYDYFANYLGSATDYKNIGWNGSIAACSAGTVSQETHTKVLQRINYYRRMGGISGTIAFDSDKNAKSQQAALMMAANSALSHNPPSTWKCYSDNGKEAAGKSNLALGGNASDAIDMYMADSGTSNTALGHRRWLLFSQAGTMGHGSVSEISGSSAKLSQDLWVFGDYPPAPDDFPPFTAWPPPSFVPSPLVYNRWSLSVPGASFNSAAVAMTDEAGNPLTVNVLPLAYGYGDNTIAWEPQGIVKNSSADVTYHVQVSNVSLNGTSLTYEYDVVIIPPPQAPVPVPPLWQNQANKFDVNCDGSVSPVDVLLVINHLNKFGSHSLPPAPPLRANYVAFDASGDGQVSAVDVLNIINYINGHSSAGTVQGGEGEASGSSPMVAFFGGLAKPGAVLVQMPAQVSNCKYASEGEVCWQFGVTNPAGSSETYLVKTTPSGDSRLLKGGGWSIEGSSTGAYFYSSPSAEFGADSVKLIYSSAETAFRLKNRDGSDWREAKKQFLRWKMKGTAPVKIAVNVETTAGPKTLIYTAVDSNSLGAGDSIHHGLGVAAGSGRVISTTRDLEEDLRDAQPDALLTYVNSLLISGASEVSGIQLTDAPALASAVRYDADDSAALSKLGVGASAGDFGQVFLQAGSKEIIISDFIALDAINTKKVYRLGGYFKSMGSSPSILWYGFDTYDANKNRNAPAGVYKWSAALSKLIPQNWTRVENNIINSNFSGNSVNLFPAGTAYVRLILRLNYAQSSAWSMAFDRLYFGPAVRAVYDAEEYLPLQRMPSAGIATEGTNHFYFQYGPKTIAALEPIPVAAGKAYNLGGYFRSGATVRSHVSLGLLNLDRNGVFISSPAAQLKSVGSEATIDRVSPGGTSINLQTFPLGWNSSGSPGYARLIGFYFDGNTAKAPDFVLIPADVMLGAYNNAFSTSKLIALNAAVPSAVVSNIKRGISKVKNLSDTPNISVFPDAPSTWSRFEIPLISGENSISAPNTFRPGAAFVRVVVVANEGQTAREKLVFDSLQLRELP